jgi:hypothetical protein
MTPRLELTAPRGGASPWLVAAGAALAGAALARLLQGGTPWAVRWGIGAFLGLVVPAHLLAFAEWGIGGRLFRIPLWAAAAWGTAGAAWCAVGLARPRRRGAGPPPEPGERRRPRTNPTPIPDGRIDRDPLQRWLGVVVLLVGGLHLHSVLRTVRHGARSWDGESYHLPVPLQWLSAGSLTEPLARLVTVSPAEIDRFANPGNGHLLMALPLAVGWDGLAHLVQWAFLPLAAWAVFALARRSGASGAAAALGACGFLGAPIVSEQAAVPMLDLATAALSLAGLAVLARAAHERAVPWRALALASLAFGLALGTKTTALAHLALAGALVWSSSWAWHARRRDRLAALGLASALLAMPCLIWWGRSASLFGNPVHPIRIRVLGLTLADGATAEDMSGYWDLERMKMRSRWEWPLLPVRDPEYSDESGFGALFAGLLALGIAAGALDVARAVRARRAPPRARLAVLAGVALLVFWFGAARTPRFNLPMLGLLAALGGVASDRLGGRRARHALGALAAVAAALTLSLSMRLHGWDVGPPLSRAELLGGDWPGIPAGIDALPPRVVFNDTQDDESARICNYKLFGADHRHLVFDHPQLPVADPAGYVARLRALGADAVFLRRRRGEPEPARFATDALFPELSYEAREYRSTLYRVR